MTIQSRIDPQSLALLLDFNPGSIMVVSIETGADIFLTELKAYVEIVNLDSAFSVVESAESPELVLAAVDAVKSGIACIWRLDSWQESDFIELDKSRTRLLQNHSILMLLSPLKAKSFLNCSPNLRSFVGGNVFIGVLEQSILSAEESEAKLEAFRQEFKKTDLELIDAVVSKSIDLEPGIVEWLVLLGRGDLLK